MIRANQLTLLRIVLLPLPCYLMFGGSTHRIIALLLFVLLGLTDYFDGLLARKQGITTLGRLLDPIADKIFIAAVYIPFARMGIVPTWMVVLLFIREFAVVELRSIQASGGSAMGASTLAKYKTTIQMLGGGFIFLIATVGESPTVFFPLIGSFLLAALPGILTWRRSGKVGPRGAAAVVLVGTVLCARLFLPPERATWLIMAIILAITLVSGAQYFSRCRALSILTGKEWSVFLSAVAIFPTLYILVAQSQSLPLWIPLGILSLAFATGGLYNVLLAVGGTKERPVHWRRTLFQNAMGALVLAMVHLTPPGYPTAAGFVLGVVLAVTLFHTLRDFWIHRVRYLLA
jgi:CDP-diacylglycerol--glycerol-3-phosphate 3-phosphatidyltransferase